MKFMELMIEQRLIIQLQWGEQKIEFNSRVVEKDNAFVYVTPYLHNGSELEINVLLGKGVICNIFTDDPSTGQRISWKNVELKTVRRDDDLLYGIKTSGFNNVSNVDDRRTHDRIVIQTKAQVFDTQLTNGVDVLVHDISDIGISFYAPSSFTPRTQQLVVIFSDFIDDKVFDVRVECSILRMVNKAGNILVGCRISGENKDYQIYGFLKRLKDKSKFKELGNFEIGSTVQPREFKGE